MKALSLWQPWATAIARGLKKYETRSWGTDYRGPLAIHASKKWSRDLRELAKARESILGIPFPGVNVDSAKPTHGIPLGAVVVVVDLVDCLCMSRDWLPTATSIHIDSVTIAEQEWGDWRPSRYAWKLENARVLATPVEMQGQRGLWTPDPIHTDAILAQLEDA